MLNRMLEAILRGLVVLHQENIAIAREISGNEGVEQLWNEMFFSAIKDVASVEGGDVESEKIPKNKKTSSATRSKGGAE